MRIGRDHIASTVYTIAFAYAGAALPILILVSLYDRPLLDALTTGELAEEIIRILAGSIGLVLAIPVTTLLAVLVVKASARTREAPTPAHHRNHTPLPGPPRSRATTSTTTQRSKPSTNPAANAARRHRAPADSCP